MAGATGPVRPPQGPGRAQLQHGGPPSALLDPRSRAAGARTGRADLVAMRLAAEFVGPVPVGEVEVAARVVRAARSAVLVDATPVRGRARVPARTGLAGAGRGHRRGRRAAAAAASRCPAIGPIWAAHFPYDDTIDWQSLTGVDVASPARAARGPVRCTRWCPTRRCPGCSGWRSSATRPAASPPSSTGTRWSFSTSTSTCTCPVRSTANGCMLDAHTSLGPQGAALARSTVSDVRGEVGCTAQTLVLAPRPFLTLIA